MSHPTRQFVRLSKHLAAWAVTLGASWPLHADAQTSATASDTGGWRFRGSLYGYLPSLGGSASVPADPNGVDITVDGGKILDNLKFMVMGAFDAHNGRWGVFTDLMYFNLGNAKDQSRDFTIGNIGIPAGATAHLDLRMEGLIWTSAGQYRLVSDPALTLDALGGARLLDLKQDLSWNITGNIGPLTPAGRTGSHHSKLSNWDAIVGVKGRYALVGSNWSLPYYLDVGTGESDLTWQVAAGAAYTFSWGELVGLWRYLAYEMKSGRPLNDLTFNGPMVGLTLRW